MMGRAEVGPRVVTNCPLPDAPIGMVPRARGRHEARVVHDGVSESQIADMWRRGGYPTVVTTRGQSLKVLYPGRPSPHIGPDFRDALLATEDGRFVRGDVEVHINRRGWEAHGHHRDPLYRQVVLHVFMHGALDGAEPNDGGGPAEAVVSAPVVINDPGNPRFRGRAMAAPLERLRVLARSELELWLDEAGERRFLARAASMTHALRLADAREVAYAGVMEGLGYSRNRRPMLLLAKGLPMALLLQLAGGGTHAVAMEAVLAGAAGLLPRQRHTAGAKDAHDFELERLWQAAGQPRVVPEGSWAVAGVRPQNRPVRRLEGAAHLLTKHASGGLLVSLEELVRTGRPADLQRGLQVTADGRLTRHIDIHLPTPPSVTLIGAARARELAINAVLPLFLARAHMLGDRELRAATLLLFHRFPPGQDNELTREVMALLPPSKSRRPVIDSAKRQQGLIHLYHVLRGVAR